MYFSDRELGPKPRTIEQINEKVWGGICSVIYSHIKDGSLGSGFPEQCPDGRGIIGCDERQLKLTVQALVPSLPWPLNSYEIPNSNDIFDLLELLHKNIGKPIKGSYHKFYDHRHLDFDQESGQERFRQEINEVFSRNGIAFEVGQDGQVKRLVNEVLNSELTASEFHTGDIHLDRMLDDARDKFLNRRLTSRIEALEKLWDVWERLKTLENPNDKKKSITQLINTVSTEGGIINILDTEANELTSAGNKLRIRHSEVGTIPIDDAELVDYLFHRCFALIILLLRKSNRHGRKMD